MTTSSMNKQELRNALANVEDTARRLRNTLRNGYNGSAEHQLAELLTDFAKLVREEIVQ